jgi:hypothetical protein
MSDARAANLAAQAASTIESNYAIVGGATGAGGTTWSRNPLPKGTVKRSLDAEVAGEGGKVVDGSRVILSDGTVVPYVRPAEKLRIPDWSEIESIKHYFGPRGYQPYPSWFYHPVRDPVLIKDAKEAAEYGIVYRKTTEDERNRFGRNETWDWEEGCEWRPHPFSAPKLNFADHAGSKNVIHGTPDPSRVQADLVSSVAAAVAQVLKLTPGTTAPPAVDPKQWDEFIAFQAWKKANEVIAAEVVRDDVETADEPEGDNSLLSNALSPEQDRMLWEQEASRLGVKVDKRWSLATLRGEVEKASSAGNGS